MINIKNKNNFLIISIILAFMIMIAMFFIFTYNDVKVNADGLGDEISSSNFEDMNLYESLKIYYNNNNNEALDVNVLYKDLFTGFTQIDLSDKGINSLIGLETLNLTSITTLTLNNNNLTNITGDNINHLTNLNTLNVNNNQITSITLKDQSPIKNISAYNNNLSEIDLSTLRGTLNVDLSNNNFDSITKIKRNAGNGVTSVRLILLNNNITDIVESDLQSLKIKYILGLQGLKQLTTGTTDLALEINTDKKIVYYKINDTFPGSELNDLKVQIEKTLDDSIVLTYTNTDSSLSNINILNIMPNNYRVKYYDTTTNTEKYSDANKLTTPFETQLFKVIPAGVTYYFTYNGKQVDRLDSKISNSATMNVTSIPGSKIYYRYSYERSSDWHEVEDNKINVPCNGGYSISVYTQYIADGVEDPFNSQVTRIEIVSNLNEGVSDVVILLLVALVAVVLFVVVLPLIKKFVLKK